MVWARSHPTVRSYRLPPPTIAGEGKSSSQCRLSCTKDHGVVCHTLETNSWSGIHWQYGHWTEVSRVARASLWPWNGPSQHDKQVQVHAGWGPSQLNCWRLYVPWNDVWWVFDCTLIVMLHWIEWPSYSSDLNPCDFLLWGYINDGIYRKPPDSLETWSLPSEMILIYLIPIHFSALWQSFRIAFIKL